jgi:PAS domain-containing protein
MPEDSAKICRSSDKEALEKNQLIENFEQVEDHYFIAHKFPVPLGSQIGVGGFITDITRQVNADASIRLQSKALEVAANAILITDPEGSIEWANQAFSSLTRLFN